MFSAIFFKFIFRFFLTKNFQLLNLFFCLRFFSLVFYSLVCDIKFRFVFVQKNFLDKFHAMKKLKQRVIRPTVELFQKA